MSLGRQYKGLEQLAKEVAQRINPHPLEEMLVRDGRHQRQLYSAKSFMDRYHKRFPKIKEFTKNVKAAIKQKGYIFSIVGRRYHLSADRSFVGVNRLVQGLSGDFKKIAAIRVYRMLKELKSRTRLVNDIHDELDLDVHKDEIILVEKIKNIMEDFPQVRVKIKVDVSYSETSWADKKKWQGRLF